jgi:O-antigen ligase
VAVIPLESSEPEASAAPASPAGGAPPSLLLWARRFYALHLLTIFGIALSNVFLGLTILTSPFALRGDDRPPIPWQKLRPLYRPLGLYVLLLAAAIVASYEPRVSAGSLSELTSLATLFLGPLLIRGERAVRRLVEAITLLGAGIALYGLAQFLYGYGGLEHRIRGPFSHWMTFAGVLLLCDLLALARLAVDPRSRKPWRWAAVAVITLGLLGSLTRGAFLALVVALTVLLAVRRPRSLAALLPAALLFVLLAPIPLLSRMLSIGDLRDGSNYDRLCMIDAGLHMVAERPLFGIGPDMVQRRYPLYRHPTAPRYWVPHLHNSFLQLAAERGIPALAAYLWMMAVPIALAARRFRREGGFAGPRADLYLGAALALIGFNLAGVFEYNWGDTEVQRIVLFLLALPFCLERGGATPTAG